MRINRMMAAFLGITVLPLISAQQIQDVRLMPTRISLTSERKSDTVLVVNHGTSPIRYRVSLVDKQMTQNGSLIDPVAPMANSAKNYIRIAPKEITLSPGAWQKVKVLSTLPPTAATGEYRVHLALTPIKVPSAAKPASASNETQLKIQLEMQSAVTIPIFISHGRLSASSKISDIKLMNDENGSKLTYRLERTGTRTIRGNCTVFFTPEWGGKPVVVSEARSVPLYYPNASRIVTMPLNRALESMGSGTIEVRFAEAEAQGATASLKVLVTSGK